MKNRILLTISLLLLGLIVNAQTYEQLGSDLTGAPADNFGTTVASSADGSIIAASSPTELLRGEVKIYELSGNSLVQRGATLQGEANSDNFGKGLSMSADGSILAIGAPSNRASFGEFSNSGRVYIYEWDGSSYIQIATLDASASGESFGDALSISANGNILAVTAPFAAGGGSGKGAVRVYERSGNDYLQIGSDLNGVQDNELFGNSVDIAVTATDTVLVVGAPSFSSVPGNFDDSGQARIFNYNGTSWSSTDTFTGDLGALFGNDVSLSDDGSRLAVGTMVSLFSPINTYFEVYEYTTSWQLLGSRITTNTFNDEFSKSITIAGDGSRLIVGAPGFVDPDSPNGYVNIYEYATSDWNRLDSIVGDASGDIFGTSVATTTTGEQFVVGAPLNGAGGETAGQVKVYGPPIPDTEAPTVSFATSEPEFETTVPLLATATFSEEVTGFESTDLTIDNGTVTNFSTADNIVFDIEITPAADGVIIVSVAADVANDLAGNANEASESDLILKYDASTPELAILTDTLFNSTTPFLFGSIKDAFPKSVSLRIDGGSTVYQTGISDTAWFTNSFGGDTFTDGMHTIEVTALDSADNQTVIDSIFYIDTTKPTVAITVPDSVGNTTSFDASISFSEVVSGFDITDITVGNGTIDALTTQDSISFTVTITPSADGEVTLEVAENRVQDAAGNFNTASNKQITQFDNTPPELFLENVPAFTNSNDFQVDFVVSEDLSAGVPVSSYNIDNAEVIDFVTLPSDFAVGLLLRPSGADNVHFSFPANIAQDKFGNSNEASETYVIKYDDTVPVVSINEQIVTESGPITLNGTIEETNLDSLIIGVGATDYIIPQENIGNGAWSLTLENLSEGTYDISARAVDSARNEASITRNEGLIYDFSFPTVDIQNLGETISDEPVMVTFTFSEPIVGFDENDIVLSNVSLSDFSIIDNQKATAKVTITEGLEQGALITLNIPVSSFEDLAGNPNQDEASASAELDFKYSGGTGTESDPFIIATGGDLLELSSTEEDWGSHFQQIANITLNENEPFSPIGRNETPFSGTYDGQGYQIVLSNIKNEFLFSLQLFNSFYFIDGAGLFGYTSSSIIKNVRLHFNDLNFIETPQSAFCFGLIAVNGGTTSTSTIENCMTTGKVSIDINSTNSGTENNALIGGLVGSLRGPILIDKSFSDLELNLKSSRCFAGGLLGDFFIFGLGIPDASDLPVIIRNSYSLSFINEIDNEPGREVQIGGLVGRGFAGVTIQNSFFAGRLHAENEELAVGAIMGKQFSNLFTADNLFWDKDLASSESLNSIGGYNIGEDGPLNLEEASAYQTSEIKFGTKFTELGWDISAESENNESSVWKYGSLGYPYLNWQDETFEEFTISGQVVDEGGNPFGGATVELGKQEGGTQFKNSVTTDNQGNFTIQSPSVGFHSITVKPNNADYEITYFGDTKSPLFTRQIHYDRSMTIRMVPKAAPQGLDGAGRVKGNVVAANGATRMVTGRMLEGDPLAGVDVSLLRVEDNEILITIQTDGNGEYEIIGIPAGEYQLLLNMPGVDVNLEGSSFSMDKEGTPLVISAAVSEEGVVFNIEEEVLGIENEIEVAVYPNPVSDFVNIEIPGQAVVRIIDVSGTVLKEENFTDNLKLNISELHSNMYFLEITNAKGKAMKKLVKN